MTMILGIETTTRMGTFAIVRDGHILAEEIISDNLRHAGSFEAALNNLLQTVQLERENLDAIAVGLGPGSFTGIRVGLTVAKGLSFGLRKCLWGVSTLDVLAHQISFPYTRIPKLIARTETHPTGTAKARELETDCLEENVDMQKICLSRLSEGQDVQDLALNSATQLRSPGYMRVCPIISGERGEVYGALYEKKGEKIRKILPEFNILSDQLSGMIGKESFVFGPGLEKTRDTLESFFDKSFVDEKLIFPKAGTVAMMAQDSEWRLEGSAVVPLYVKMLAIGKSMVDSR